MSAAIVLTAGTLAYADEVIRSSSAAGPDRPRAARQARLDRVPVENRGLGFPLRAAGAAVRIEAELRLEGKVIMTEQRVVGADVPRVVQLFSRGAGHFPTLRAQDARTPGRVQLRILQDGQPVFDSSLTEFDTRYTAAPARAGAARKIAANGQCEDTCTLLYDDCLQSCDPQGQGCENCWRYFQDCMAACPDCDDWEEVSRTLIGRRNSGTSNILGAQYCHFEEYYLVEETNPAGCYPNRTVCDYDDDIIFYGFGSGHPSEGQCCNDDPGDENYCGGDTTTC